MSIKALAEVVLGEIGGTKVGASRAVVAMFKAISEATADGRNVTIKGFGTFKRAKRSARVYATRGGEVSVPDRKVLSFRCVPSQRREV
jgi:nucleoid DNA-binding protein